MVQIENNSFAVVTSPNTMHLSVYNIRLAKARNSTTINDVPSHTVAMNSNVQRALHRNTI